VVSSEQTLSAATYALLKSAGRAVEYARNKVLFREGEASQHVLLIENGEVKVTSTSATGYTFLLARRGSGQLVGEFGAAGDVPRGATVTTIGVVTGYLLTAQRFRELLRHPGVALELVRLVADRAREADRHRLELAAYPAIQRVIRVLLDQSQRQGSATIAMLQQDLASAAGTSLESVGRAVRELRKRGVITTSPGQITIVEVDLLYQQLEM